MASVSTLLIVCAFICVVDAIKPKPVTMLQQDISSKKNPADCATCNQPNQFCDFRSWSNFCKACPVCGIDHFCDTHGYCKRCPGVYLKPTQACERIDETNPRSDGNYVEGKPVKLAFATVGDDLFYLSALPNNTEAAVANLVVPTPVPASNSTAETNTTTASNTTTATPTASTLSAVLSTTPSKHVIEEITAGSGQYRIKFDDTLGGYLTVILPASPVVSADGTIDTTGDSAINFRFRTVGLAQICRDFAGFTTFNVEHSASFSWRFRVGSDENSKYLAWCGQATCGDGVPTLRLVGSEFCGSLTTSGIRCDVMITN